jgi:hypothetical protein
MVSAPLSIVAMNDRSSTNTVDDDTTNPVDSGITNAVNNDVNNATTTTQPPASEEALFSYSKGTSFGRLCGTSDPSVLDELSA